MTWKTERGAELFGFALATAYVPQFWGGATSPRWAVAALALAVLAPLRLERWTLAYLAGLAFLLWASVSLAWAASLNDGLDALIKLVIMAAAFHLAAETEPVLDRFTIGAAIGLGISSAVSVVQLDDWKGVADVGGYPSGLFVNGNMLAEAAAMVMVGCIVFRRWALVPLLVPALILPNCRGALVAFGVAGLVWLWARSKRATAALVLTGVPIAVALYLHRASSIDQRLTMWLDTLPEVTLWGRGLGSFYTLYPYFGTGWDSFIARPEHAHNDALEVAFELGWVGFGLAAAFIATVWRRDAVALIGLCFLVEGCFEFPLHIPFTAVYAALVAGHLAGGRADLRVPAIAS